MVLVPRCGFVCRNKAISYLKMVFREELRGIALEIFCGNNRGGFCVVWYGRKEKRVYISLVVIKPCGMVEYP